MEIHDIGEGSPEIAVIGLVHGDEPCGEAGIRAILDDPPDVTRPVRFIIANEAARAENARYLDDDLNRVFHRADATAASHERQLAATILDAIADCEMVLSLHSTHSTDELFAAFANLTADGRAVCRALPVSVAIDCSTSDPGTLVHHENVIEIECGYQGSDTAAANAERVIHAFLEATAAVPTADAVAPTAVDVFCVEETVPKPAGGAEFIAENFQRVAAGEPYAVTADGDRLRAEYSFYPVLMSTDGYADIIGYTAAYKGRLCAPSRH